MKTAFILLVLTLVFFFGFLVRVETKILGPTSPAEVDDLQIQEAYLDHSSNTLVLVTHNQWTRVPLTPIIQTNGQLRTPVPRDGNSVHWKSFRAGRPAADQIRQMEKVAIATDQFASFAYYHFPPDGRARHNSEVAVSIPDGYQMALYRSAAEYGPAIGQDNVPWFKSYVLATTIRQADGQFGIQFYYNPDYSRSIVFQPPYRFGLFGPSFIGLCIALPVALINWQGLATGIAFGVAFLFHAWSFLIYGALVAYGEAWGGGSSVHDKPFTFFKYGSGVLLALICVRIARAFISRLKSSNTPLLKTPTNTTFDY